MPFTKPPSWWTQNLDTERSAPSRTALRAAGRLYGSATRKRHQRESGYRALKPVICVGNFTAGGAGKTPLAIALAAMLRERGLRPAFLSRGYGGEIEGPHMVDPDTDTAEHIGDEPFLLAEHGPVMICADRSVGARILELVECDVIIMDDGMQNPTLAKDLTLAIVDASVGDPFGNGEVIPAGPLRAPLNWQKSLADAIVVVSDENRAVRDIRETMNFERPIFRATLDPINASASGDKAKAIAFCGIGKPEKFFQTLADLDLDIIAHIAFDDHHPFTEKEAAELVERAEQAGADLLTTRKDAVRIQNAKNTYPGFEKLKSMISVVDVELNLISDDHDRFEALIDRVLGKNDQREA